MPQLSQIVIRRASNKDAAQIADIYNEGIDERCATFITTHFTVEDMLYKIAEGGEKHPIFVATQKRLRLCSRVGFHFAVQPKSLL